MKRSRPFASHQHSTAELAPGGQVVRNAGGHYMVTRSLADPEVADLLATMQSDLSQSPKRSTELLQRAGVLDANGRVTKLFGG